MATATRNRASRAAAAPAVSTADETATLSAIAAPNVIERRTLSATEACVQAAATAYRAGINEVLTGVEIQIAAGLTTGPIAKLFVASGNCVGRALAVGYPEAMVALKADYPAFEAEWKTVTVKGETLRVIVNLPDLGEAMLDYGKSLMEASRPGTKKPATFVRNADQHLFADAARKYADKAFMTPEERAKKAEEARVKASEAAAKKKAKEEAEAKAKADGAIVRGNGEDVKIENARDAARVLLNVAVSGDQICRKNAIHISPRVKEAYANLEKLCRETWEEYRDADGLAD